MVEGGSDSLDIPRSKLRIYPISPHVDQNMRSKPWLAAMLLKHIISMAFAANVDRDCVISQTLVRNNLPTVVKPKITHSFFQARAEQ